MAQQDVLAPADLQVLSNLQPAISGEAQARFLQAAIDYFNAWTAAQAGKAVPYEQALLLVYSESPDSTPGLPISTAFDVRRRASALTLSGGAASATENLFNIRHLVPSFTGIEDALSFIEDNLTEQQTFALLLFGQSRVLVHDRGSKIEDWVQTPRSVPILRKDPFAITPAMIADQLDDFHKDHLQHVRGATARVVWNLKAEKPELLQQAELRVQSALLVHLKGIYRSTCAFVDEEVSNNGGRVDIRIARANPPTFVRSITMIELKVLYPYKSDDDNEKWGLDGIDQAHRYKSMNLDTDEAFACIYDARPDKTSDLPALKPRAHSVGIVLKLHPMETPPLRPPKPVKVLPPASAKRTTSRGSSRKPPTKQGAAKKSST